MTAKNPRIIFWVRSESAYLRIWRLALWNEQPYSCAIIINYITGVGPQGMIPRPAARIFLAGENEFYFAEDMETDVAKNIMEEDMTIETICNYLKDYNWFMEK